MGLYLLEHRGSIPLFLLWMSAPKPMVFLFRLLDDLSPSRESAADEEDILGVDLDELLVGMLAAAWGERWPQYPPGFSAGPVARPQTSRVMEVFSLLRAIRLVDLVHVDDAALSQLMYVVVGSLHQSQEDVLHVVAHISGLGEVVASAMAKGTFRIQARVWANRVLPQPVGP